MLAFMRLSTFIRFTSMSKANPVFDFKSAPRRGRFLRKLAENKLLPDSMDTTTWEILAAAPIFVAGLSTPLGERCFPDFVTG